ncbi:unnamed protein product, partial [Allacma fusca]
MEIVTSSTKIQFHADLLGIYITLGAK